MITWTLGWLTAVESSATGIPDSDGCTAFIETSKGWLDSPNIRSNVISRDQSDGDIDGPAYLPGRVITLDGWIEAPSNALLMAYMRKLRALLVAGNRVDTLTRADGDVTLQATVRRDGQTLIDPGADTWFTFEMLLYAADPTLYSATLHTTGPTSLYSGASGRTFPMAFPMAYGALGNQGILTVHNAGNLDAYPVLTLTAPTSPVVNPQVRLVGGSLIRLGMTLNVGDSITIDLAEETVVLNGVASRYYTVTGDSVFFSLPPGDSQLLFTADSGTGAQLAAAWRDPYG